MSDRVQVHAFIPRQLKRRAFSTLASQERRFTDWLCDALEAWLQEEEQPITPDVRGKQEAVPPQQS